MFSHFNICLTGSLDIRRAARILMAEHGGQAAQRAAQRLTELKRCGDVAGSRRWRDIVAEIARLLAQKPAAGSAMQLRAIIASVAAANLDDDRPKAPTQSATTVGLRTMIGGSRFDWWLTPFSKFSFS